LVTSSNDAERPRVENAFGNGRIKQGEKVSGASSPYSTIKKQKGNGFIPKKELEMVQALVDQKDFVSKKSGRGKEKLALLREEQNEKKAKRECDPQAPNEGNTPGTEMNKEGGEGILEGGKGQASLKAREQVRENGAKERREGRRSRPSNINRGKASLGERRVGR